jgi:hypothetical protein
LVLLTNKIKKLQHFLVHFARGALPGSKVLTGIGALPGSEDDCEPKIYF